MAKTNPNDPVTPQSVSINQDGFGWSGGLTKREYFAAMALQGLLGCSDTSGSHDFFASDAVKYADALIKELNK